MEKQLASIKETASALGVSPDTIRRMISKSEIRSVRVSERVLIPITEIARVVNNSAKSPHPETQTAAGVAHELQST